MLSGLDALILLPFVTPIALWATWSDLKFMKIPNKAVIALGLVFIVIGPFLLPFHDWLWGLAIMGIALVAGFVLSSIHLIGAGDAKFAAAMAPFFVGADVAFILYLFAAVQIIAFVLHRIIRRLGPVRRAAPDWVSWTHKQFPMCFALAGDLLIYLGWLAWTDFLH
jgi:prepilin peptidase CpaA